MPDQSYLRVIPKQKRSIARFNHILDTADQLFAAQGYDNVSTNHIAGAAGVAVGSLYHFFPDKSAILQALLDRYSQKIEAIFPEDVAPPRVIEEVLGEMVTRLGAYMQENPNMDQIMLYDPQATNRLHDQIVAWIEQMLGAQFPTLNAERRHLCAVTGVALVKGLLTLSHPPTNIAPQIVGTEIVRALTGYLQRFILAEGINGSSQIFRSANA